MSEGIEAEPITTFSEYDVKDKYNGYLRLIKMVDVINSVPADSIVTESVQSHGQKRIIFTTSGTHDLQRFRNRYAEGSGINLRDMNLAQFDTFMQSGVDKGGVYTGVGTFDPNEGEDIVVNIHGQHIVRSNPDMYSIEMYDTDFATLLTHVQVQTATGDLIVSGTGGGTQKIELMIGESTRFIIEDGKITLSGTTLEFALTDLHVLGNLWVTNATTLSGTTLGKGTVTAEGLVESATLTTSGNANLHGGRVNTN